MEKINLRISEVQPDVIAAMKKIAADIEPRGYHRTCIAAMAFAAKCPDFKMWAARWMEQNLNK